jgi:hypothetical protein
MLLPVLVMQPLYLNNAGFNLQALSTQDIKEALPIVPRLLELLEILIDTHTSGW